MQFEETVVGFANNSYLINKLEVCNFRKFESISVEA